MWKDKCINSGYEFVPEHRRSARVHRLTVTFPVWSLLPRPSASGPSSTPPKKLINLLRRQRKPPRVLASHLLKLSPTPAISQSQLPKPCIKGCAVSIRISDDEYQKGLLSCQNNLHGRLILPKGTTPAKVTEVRDKLFKLWSPIGQWKIIPLGRGFYEFCLASAEDLRSISALGTCVFTSGVLISTPIE